MAVNEIDIKKLWGRAAGKCSYPNCTVDCIPFLNNEDPTVIGEMAHIIARMPNGPRGIPSGGSNTYENLILLCPTHHRTIDKAPEGTFPPELLHQWKSEHEERVNNSLLSIKYSNRKDMARAIKRLLLKNHKEWIEYGPESKRAKENPISNMSEYWDYIKLSKIIPNNKKIVSIITLHEELIEISDYELFTDFIVHAESFEHSCYVVLEDSKRYPVKFTEVIDNYGEI